MEPKSSPDKIGIFPEAVEVEDLILGALGAIGGAVLFGVLQPFPPADGGSWLRGEALPSGAAVFGWLLAFLAYAGFGFFSLVLARVDVRTQTLPNGLVAWATLWTIPLLALAGHFRGEGINALGAWFSMAVSALLVFVLWLRVRPGIGGGDLKLVPVAAFVAAWGPPKEALPGVSLLFVGLFLVGWMVMGLVALIRDVDVVPAGPVLVAASWITFVVTRIPAF